MDSFWGNIFRGDSKKEEIHTILKGIPIFRDLGSRELGSIAQSLHRRKYEEGEVIFRQGVPGAGMYIILDGEVSIMYEKTGKELASLGNGEFFGELALLDESPRSATAVAKNPAIVLGFFQSDLFGIMERNPKLGAKVVLRLARIIGERLKSANDQVHDLQDQIAIKEEIGDTV